MFDSKQILLLVWLMASGCANGPNMNTAQGDDCDSWEDQCLEPHDQDSGQAAAKNSTHGSRGSNIIAQTSPKARPLCNPWESCESDDLANNMTPAISHTVETKHSNGVSIPKVLSESEKRIPSVPVPVPVVKSSVEAGKSAPGGGSMAAIPQSSDQVVAGRQNIQQPKFPATPAGSISSRTRKGTKYLVGPGDTIQIFVWRNPEVTVTVPVRPDGKISTPLVEDMLAVGKTPTLLARDIEKILRTYIRDPVVTVIVTGFGGAYSQQIRVIGQAAQPQTLAYQENMSLLDVIIVVGGLTEYAAGNRATIVREIEGERTQIRVKLNDLVKKGDINANVFMKPGDILIIPESWF